MELIRSGYSAILHSAHCCLELASKDPWKKVHWRAYRRAPLGKKKIAVTAYWRLLWKKSYNKSLQVIHLLASSTQTTSVVITNTREYPTNVRSVWVKQNSFDWEHLKIAMGSPKQQEAFPPRLVKMDNPFSQTPAACLASVKICPAPLTYLNTVLSITQFSCKNKPCSEGWN